MAGAGHDANAHLAAAHDMYNEERYIAAGHHLELALAGGASLKDEQEDQWARRCADDAAAAVQLRDAIESSAAKASTGWKLSTDAKGIEVLYRSEPSTPILSIAAHFDVMATVASAVYASPGGAADATADAAADDAAAAACDQSHMQASVCLHTTSSCCAAWSIAGMALGDHHSTAPPPRPPPP